MFSYWLNSQRARWLFWLALAGVTALALMPGDEVPITTGWDKSNHVLAFFTLTLLGRLSWPRASWWLTVASLIGYGIAIEGVQYLVGREAAVQDVFADTIGIVVCRVLLMWSARQRMALTP